MNEEQVIKPKEIGDQQVNEGIKLDYGICKCLYHGTSKYNAQEIQKTNKIKIPNKVNYLGKGFYCYHWDMEASRIWARKRNKTEKIAVLDLVANLGNIFFISKEVYQVFRNKAIELRDSHLHIDERIGNYIELFIKEFIKPKYGIDIHTVGRYHILRYYIFDKNVRKRLGRCVLMYSLRDKIRVKKIEICWEEK